MISSGTSVGENMPNPPSALIAGMPEASARSGSAWRLGLCSGGVSASMKMLPPRVPALPVSTESTWMRYEVSVENDCARRRGRT